MATLLERVRRGLAPEYDVRNELAHGGMGVVFLAHDTALDRRVAVKIIRPEIATARAVERFIREARLLASLNHPNVVPVHRAGEVDGIPYYVMEYLEGETLAARLARGPLSREEALKLGRDLLDALGAVHGLGVVHRDVKPSNIFLLGRRALLADFGVARARVSGQTDAGLVGGTPGYMSPEQVSGDDVTPRSDLYAAAVVVYEALTGRQLEAPKPVDEVDWHGVPHSLVPVLRRGLAWSPDARWPDAAPFRHALWDTRKQPYRQRTVALTAAGVLVGGVIIFILDLLATRPGPPLLAIEPFTVTEPTLPPSLGDSLACLVARDLSGNPDFVARCPGGRSDGPPDAAVRGTVTSMEDSICVEVRVEGLVRVSQQLAAGACAPSGALNELAQRAGVLVLYEIWKSQDAIIRDVPRQHLPRDPRAVTAFLEGERAFSRARWGEALAAYGEAEAIDSTCRLCSWRVYDAQRWHGLPHDLRHIARFVQAAGSFPPHYQSLLRAPGLPLAARLDTLVDAAKRHFRSPLIWWSLGEELFHRGPIVGRERRDAIDAFQQAVALRSDFGPAWEHLAWAYTAEGDSAGADSALAHWRATMRGDPSDTFTLGLRSLLETGFAWRFFDTAQAVRRTRAALAEPAIAASADLIVAPRFLPTFDALPGAVWLGRLFASDRRSHFQSAGLLAMGLAFSALGRPDSAEARLGELVARFPDEELQLFVVQYPAALAAIDPVPFGDRRTALRTALTRLAAPGSAEPIRHRAAATLSVLTLLDSEPAESPPHLPPGDLTPAQRALLGAVRAGREGRWVVALARTEAIRRDSAAHVSDPTLRAITRLLRAEWLDSMGNVDAARRELRWADHSWTIYWPVGPPQAAEVDWSLRTLARWRRARLLDRAGVRDRELCASYVHVARDWAAGMPVYAARADTARQRHHAVGCPTLR